MSAIYLFECECGRSVELRNQQAGTEIQCPGCDQTISVPTLRELSKLPRLDETKTASAVATKESWSREKGILFALGLPMFLLGSGLLVYLAMQSGKLMTERPTVERAKQMLGFRDSDIMDKDPLETWDTWKKVRAMPIESVRRFEPYYEEQRRIAARYKIYMAMTGLLAVIGVGLLAAMLMVKKRR